MWTIFLFIFIICLIIDYVEEGGSFAALTRWVEFANSFKPSTPRVAKVTHNAIVLEYKYGHKLFALIAPFPKKASEWKSVGALIDDKWHDVTQDVKFVAGPFKDFHGIALKPEHINDSFRVLGFAFDKDKVVKVNRGEVILLKLKAATK